VLGRRWVHEAVGADFLCSVVYGMQTVLFVLVARNAGLGMHGYGYLFAALGVGALVGTSLAGRVLRLPFRTGLALAMGLVGLSMLALPAAHWGALAIVLACVNGAGAILVEVMTETGLQRMLPADVFGRAYSLALPASIGGIVAGSLIAPVLVSAIGLTGALVACGSVATAYGLHLIAGRGHLPSPAPTPATPVSPLTPPPPLTRPAPTSPAAALTFPAELPATAPWPISAPSPAPAPAMWRPASSQLAAASRQAEAPHRNTPVDPSFALAPTAPWPTVMPRRLSPRSRFVRVCRCPSTGKPELSLSWHLRADPATLRYRQIGTLHTE
jgi:MFS family permease